MVITYSLLTAIMFTKFAGMTAWLSSLSPMAIEMAMNIAMVTAMYLAK